MLQQAARPRVDVEHVQHVALLVPLDDLELAAPRWALRSHRHRVVRRWHVLRQKPDSTCCTGGAGLECILGEAMSDSVTLTAVFTPDENGWTMAQLAEWPAVVTCGRTVEEAREMLLDAAREMIASYRDQGREPPIGGGHVEQITIDVAAA